MGKQVEEFDELEHYKEICEWYDEHGLRAPGPDMLPKHGAIVRGLAAGFLILTDANLGILEFYISNPKAGPRERDLALDLITRALLDLGEEYGITNFKADTKIPAIVKRAERFDFKKVGTFTALFLQTKTECH
jgi:hypothetical protein